LKTEATGLRERLASSEQEITALKEFKTLAISQLAAQQDEITRLRAAVARQGALRSLPSRSGTDATAGQTAGTTPQPDR
jgi:hypothetical protein